MTCPGCKKRIDPERERHHHFRILHDGTIQHKRQAPLRPVKAHVYWHISCFAEMLKYLETNQGEQALLLLNAEKEIQ
jgi:hypothetical protein